MWLLCEKGIFLQCRSHKERHFFVWIGEKMENEFQKKIVFKELCQSSLKSFGVSDLRCFGRYLQLERPTDMKKDLLIDEILAVLCGEIQPTRTNRGAPVNQVKIIRTSPKWIF